jgi:hypothetical protein
MPGRSYEVIFPNGEFEIDASGQRPPPAVGETIRRRGKLWRVTATTGVRPVIVRVELAEAGSKDVR